MNATESAAMSDEFMRLYKIYVFAWLWFVARLVGSGYPLAVVSVEPTYQPKPTDSGFEQSLEQQWSEHLTRQLEALRQPGALEELEDLLQQGKLKIDGDEEDDGDSHESEGESEGVDGKSEEGSSDGGNEDEEVEEV